jgi:hypothetical protein
MGRKKRARRRAAEKEKLETMGQAAASYNAQRGQTQEALYGTFQNQLNSYDGLNQLVGQMYGEDSMLDGANYDRAVTPGMLEVGLTSQFDGPPRGGPHPEQAEPPSGPTPAERARERSGLERRTGRGGVLKGRGGRGRGGR